MYYIFLKSVSFCFTYCEALCKCVPMCEDTPSWEVAVFQDEMAFISGSAVAASAPTLCTCSSRRCTVSQSPHLQWVSCRQHPAGAPRSFIPAASNWLLLRPLWFHVITDVVGVTPPFLTCLLFSLSVLFSIFSPFPAFFWIICMCLFFLNSTLMYLEALKF